MLILTRKRNETIQIGDGVAITVIRVSGHQVRIGVSAPIDTRIMRVELGDLPEANSADDLKTDRAN